MSETVLTAATEQAPTAQAQQGASQAEPQANGSTLLGTGQDTSGNPTPAQGKPEVQEPTAEDKALLEAKDEQLTADQRARKAELLKAQEDAKAKSVPEKYEVKVEGFEIDNQLLEGLTPVFKKHNLTQEAVQELASAYAPIVQKQLEAQRAQSLKDFNDIKEGWKADALKELGADSAKEMSYAAKFINKFGSDPFRQMLDETGVGNHPEFVKFAIKAGKAISADSFVDPSKQSTGSDDLLNSMYTHPTSKATLK